MSQASIVTPKTFRYKKLFERDQGVFPLWLMRQAGRYLPEYRALRAQHSSFLDLCRDPLIASKITLQPLQRFELDAAIIFADILLPLLCFPGLMLHFDDQKGPEINMNRSLSSVIDQGYINPFFELDYVGQAIDRVSSLLDSRQGLIGFCGSPWTVSLYAWQGKSRDNFVQSLRFIETNPDQAQEWLTLLTDCSFHYLALQVAAGATQIMIFDSWAELAPEDCFYSYVYHHSLNLMQRFKKNYPSIPLIYYPKGAIAKVLKEQEQPFDILGCDHSVDLSVIQYETSKILQGNFNPQLLFEPIDKIKSIVHQYFSGLSRSVIVNLGHGILPSTPLDHVNAFVQFVRAEEELF
jgi:uroporphyrinogen decarboxylase